jgi:hypothetical protein
MDMKLWYYTSPAGTVEILDTGGTKAANFERQLALCRSLTLVADRLILGPEHLGQEISLQILDWQGQKSKLDPWSAQAFSTFLRDAGYNVEESCTLWDGTGRIPLPEPDPRWSGHRVDVAELLNL